MREIVDFDPDCRSCKDFTTQGLPENLIVKGISVLGDEEFEWVVIPSRKKAVIEGSHLILTTISHHLGADRGAQRAFLLSEALDYAYSRGSNFRLSVNSGEASSIPHFHVHMIYPKGSDRLTRDVANVQVALEKAGLIYSLPREALNFLEEELLQKAKPKVPVEIEHPANLSQI